LSEIDDFGRVEGESLVKWMIFFASIKCEDEKLHIERFGFNKDIHIEQLCFCSTLLIWEPEDSRRYLENHLNCKKKKCKAKKKSGGKKEKLPLARCLVNKVRISSILILVLDLKSF
jgi:hypothetical protein